MHIKVVTIARTAGAGGEDLGTRIADSVGYRYVDDEIIDRAAALAGVRATELESVESRAPIARQVASLLGDDGTNGDPGRLNGADYERLIIDVIRETAAMELVVIVAHGAGYALRDQPATLRVLVTASRSTRAARVAAAAGIPEQRAAAEVEESDRARAAFLQRFYGVEREEPEHYDLVINTDTIAMDRLAGAVVELL